jgi:uncharacterized protein (UPF0335 family)
MTNPFDMAREMARLVDAGKSIGEIAAEMLRKFPTATAADVQRALRIGLERIEMLEEERAAAAESFADQWFGGAEPDRQAIDTVMNLKPSAETLFPKPDKSKS